MTADGADPGPANSWPAFDASGWGAPRVPFPVSVPYRPRPDLARLGTVVHGRREPRVLDFDADAPAALRAKFERLRAVPSRCVALGAACRADPSHAGRLVARAVRALLDAQDRTGDGADDGPIARGDGALVARTAGWTMPTDPHAPARLRALRPEAVPVVDWIASRPEAERPLHALALALQEDVALLETPSAGGTPRLAALHVCWPSGWDPASKVDRDFAAIHAPVADGDALRAASVPLARALCTQGPFVRFVWTLAPTGARARHPDEPEPPFGDEVWFRCERQVAVPLRDDAGPPGAVFLIRLHVAPLRTIATQPGRAARLRDAIASMTPATLAYKRLADHRDALLARLDALAR